MKKKTLLTLVLAFAATMWTGMANAQSLNSGKSVLAGKCADKTVSAKAPLASPAETYGLSIAGTMVNSDNCTDLSVIDGVTGTVSYNPETSTLTLEDAAINSSGYVGISTTTDLNIEVKGTVNVVTTGSFVAIYLGGDTNITGGGTLNTVSPLCGIDIATNLTIDGCTVTADGKWGIAGDIGKSETLTIKNANVKAKGFTGSICDIVSLTLTECVITKPEGAAYDTSLRAVALDGVVVTDEVEITPKDYGLYIAGIRVNSANCADLSVIDVVSGTVSYNPETKTLTLDNATINSSDNTSIYAEEEITIEVKGMVNIMSKVNGIHCEKAAVITGGGRVDIIGKNSCGIKFLESLTIDDCTVNADGKWGIAGNEGTCETLTINNANVSAEGTECSIGEIVALSLTGCEIIQPAGAAFDASLGAVALDGVKVTGYVLISPIRYDLYIAGIRVSSANCADLSVIDGVTGTVSYNPETKTLTLEDATINSADNTSIYAEDEITIKTKGSVGLISSVNAIRCDKAAVITGSGTLHLSADGCGILINTNLTIDGCTVIAEGKWGITGIGGYSETLTINNAEVKVKGIVGSICDIVALNLTKCEITQPQGAVYDASLRAVALDGVKVTDEVVITPNDYGLYIASTKVDSANCADLSVIDGVTGTVSYNPETKTLTLEDATISSDGMCIQSDTTTDLNIEVKGTVDVVTSGSVYVAIYLGGDTNITGGGTLNIVSPLCGIDIVSNLTIDGCTVTADGKWGIAGDLGDRETLTIKNANVKAKGTTGSICDVVSLSLTGCEIIQPAGAAFDASLGAVALDGVVVTDEVVIEPNGAGITSPIADTVLSHKQGIYNLQGMRLDMSYDALPAGIYIIDGKKIIKK